jgi:hypothetical protein
MPGFERYQMIRDQSIRDSTEDQLPTVRGRKRGEGPVSRSDEVNFGKDATKPIFAVNSSSTALVETNLATQVPSASVLSDLRTDSAGS